MKVHQVKMRSLEFSQFLIGFKNEIRVQRTENMDVNDYLIITEISDMTAKESDRHLVYRIIELDRYYGMYEDIILDKLTLERDKKSDFRSIYSKMENDDLFDRDGDERETGELRT